MLKTFLLFFVLFSTFIQADIYFVDPVKSKLSFNVKQFQFDTQNSNRVPVWSLGEKSRMTKHRILRESSSESLDLFNLSLAEEVDCTQILGQVANIISDELKRVGGCAERAVLAGFFNGCQSEKAYKDLESLDFKDVSSGMCEDEEDCFTVDIKNDLIKGIKGVTESLRSDRILVHEDTIVIESKRNFLNAKIDEHGLFKEDYAIEKIWPAPRFGWYASLQFARCPK